MASRTQARSWVRLSDAPAAMAAGDRSLWLVDPNAGSVARVDLEDRAVVDRIPVGGSPGVIAVGGGAVWVASVSGDEVARIDPTTGTVTQTLPLGGARVAALAFDSGTLWLGDVIGNALIEVARRLVVCDVGSPSRCGRPHSP